MIFLPQISDEGKMQIWADASYKSGKAGLGVLIRKLTKNGCEEIRISKSVRCRDNNLAELKAIWLGVKYMGEPETGYINIVTDSEYAIRSIKHPNREEYKGERGEIAKRIRAKIDKYKWRLYHKTAAHDSREDVYSMRQDVCDMLAKNALDNFLDDSRFSR